MLGKFLGFYGIAVANHLYYPVAYLGGQRELVLGRRSQGARFPRITTKKRTFYGGILQKGTQFFTTASKKMEISD